MVTNLPRTIYELAKEPDEKIFRAALRRMDNGTHFHLFDANERERKVWSRDLPEKLRRVVYPG